MKQISETSIMNFDDTSYTRFLKNVISVLAAHDHVSVEKINKADEEKGLVWNWLNTAAKSYNVDKIVDLLKKLNLFENSLLQDSNVILEALSSEVRSAQRTQNTQIKDDLASIMLMDYENIIKKIAETYPTAIWKDFVDPKTAPTAIVDNCSQWYYGQYRWESKVGTVRIAFRNDGYIRVTLNGANKHFCYDESMLWSWITTYEPKDYSNEQALKPEDADALATELKQRYAYTADMIRFKKSDKVIGKQTLDHQYEIWYRVNGSVFVKNAEYAYKGKVPYPKSFTTKESLIDFLDSICTKNTAQVSSTQPVQPAQQVQLPIQKQVAQPVEKPAQAPTPAVAPAPISKPAQRVSRSTMAARIRAIDLSDI